MSGKLQIWPKPSEIRRNGRKRILRGLGAAIAALWIAASPATGLAKDVSGSKQASGLDEAFGQLTSNPGTQASAGDNLTEVPELRSFVSQHEMRIHGEAVRFTVRAEESLQYNDNGVPIGSIFSYSYLRSVPNAQQRPVVFITGGGPGSASFFLQIGLGPWSLPLNRLSPENGHRPSVTPPFVIEDNQNSILDVADLVFIDPVGTGYSRIVGRGRPQDFWGIDQDADSMQQFMSQWLTKHDRWDSPKFFMGESYGGTRTALVARGSMPGVAFGRVLRGVTLNGVMILVNNLGMPGVGGDEGAGDAYLPMTFPNLAATAWYHNLVDHQGRTFEQFYAEASAFARSELLPAYRKEKAKQLAPADRHELVQKLMGYTGLPESAFATQLAFSGPDFSKMVLATRGRVVGVYDSRFTSPAVPTTGDLVADDAALSRSLPVMLDTFLKIQRQKMGIDLDQPFIGITWGELPQAWEYQHKPPSMGLPFQGDTAVGVAAAMNRNEKLQVMIATGYYDLLFSPALAEFMAERAHMPKERLRLRAYKTGHELYLDQALIPFAKDLRTMIEDASQ